MTPRCELLIVGDVHDQWDDGDAAFVERGSQDLVVFVGDLGDEDPVVIERVAALRCPKVVVLGNHDAWDASRNYRFDRLRAFDAILGSTHIGYSSQRVGDGSYAVVGARPYTWGGPWSRQRRFYEDFYGIETEEESARRILLAAEAVPDSILIVVAHNGPQGLGSTRDAIFGRDFRDPPEDFGDRDLALALSDLEAKGRRVALVVAGHMHEDLRGGGQRRRRADHPDWVCLNAAVVPRHLPAPEGVLRHFLRVVLESTRVVLAEDLWLDGRGEILARKPLPPQPAPPST